MGNAKPTFRLEIKSPPMALLCANERVVLSKSCVSVCYAPSEILPAPLQTFVGEFFLNFCRVGVESGSCKIDARRQTLRRVAELNEDRILTSSPRFPQNEGSLFGPRSRMDSHSTDLPLVSRARNVRPPETRGSLMSTKGVQEEVEDGTSMILDTGCTKAMCSRHAYLLMREGLSEGQVELLPDSSTFNFANGLKALAGEKGGI